MGALTEWIAFRKALPKPERVDWEDDFAGEVETFVADGIARRPDRTLLAPWYAALARRHGRRANIGIIGASLVEGAYVSDYSLTLAQQLAAALRRSHPSAPAGGRGMVCLPSDDLVTAPAYVPGSQPWSWAGGVLDNAVGTFGARHVIWYSSTAANATLTLDAPITSFDIVHIAGPSGHASGGYYKVDGGAGVAINTYNAVDIVRRTHVAAPATTSIEVGCTGAGWFFLSGIHEYAGDETSGIQVHNLGHAGYDTVEWVAGAAAAGSWLTEIVGLDLDLLILQDMGGNDGGGGATASTFQTRLNVLVNALRTGGIDCPIIVASVPDITEGLPMPDSWSAYVAAHANVAADLDLVHVDHAAAIPASPATGLGIYHADHVHSAADGGLPSWLVDNYMPLLAPRR